MGCVFSLSHFPPFFIQNIDKGFCLFFRSICSETSEKAVVELQQQLHEKDMKLTDIRLEALSSAHQLDQLRDTMNRMKVIAPTGTVQRKRQLIYPEGSLYSR